MPLATRTIDPMRDGAAFSERDGTATPSVVGTGPEPAPPGPAMAASPANAIVRLHAANFLAHLPIAAAILDRQTRIVTYNSAAEAEFTRPLVTRIAAREKLILHDSATTDRMARSVARVCAAQEPDWVGYDLAVEREHCRFVLSMLPFSPVAFAASGWPAEPPRLCLLLLRREKAPDAPDRWRRYGFSATERRLADAIVRGKAVRDSAAEIGITYETARSYLKQIFAKTGVRRQAELVALHAQPASPDI